MAKSSTSFQLGRSGNPGRKSIGARNRVTAAFLEALAGDFAEHGKDAIAACRASDPAAYLRICVALVPKDLHVKDDRSLLVDTLTLLDERRRAQELVELSPSNADRPKTGNGGRDRPAEEYSALNSRVRFCIDCGAAPISGKCTQSQAEPRA
jgi:hypothetical protein